MGALLEDLSSSWTGVQKIFMAVVHDTYSSEKMLAGEGLLHFSFADEPKKRSGIVRQAESGRRRRKRRGKEGSGFHFLADGN